MSRPSKRSPGPIQALRSFRYSILALAVLLVLASCRDLRDPAGPSARGEAIQALVPAGSLVFAGNARMGTGANAGWVRVAIPAGGNKGAAWHGTKQQVSGGFETSATFRMPGSRTNTTPDGFAFVIQGNGTSALGGGHFAYEGLANSAAIVFDTRDRANLNVHLRFDGISTAVESVVVPGRVDDGDSRSIRIVYRPGTIEVFLEGDKILTAPLDLGDVSGVLDTDGKAWVGFTGSTTGNGREVQIAGWDVETGPALYPVTVEVTGSPGVPGITVIATNVVTGQFYPLVTDVNGQLTFYLPLGQYVFSAYRFRISDVSQLVIWPYDVNDGVDPNLPPYSPVIFKPGVGSLLRNPANLFDALNTPVGVGPSGTSSIPLNFAQGATIQCVFLDENGVPIQPDESFQVFGVVPLPDDPRLPPPFLPPGFTAPTNNLPRGMGFGVTSVQTTGGGCTLPGAPEGLVVLESEVLYDENGDPYVYRASTEVGPDGETIMAAGPMPALAKQFSYFGEPWGDASGDQDIGGAIIAGWRRGAQFGDLYQPASKFIVSTQFRGDGIYRVEVWRDATNKPYDVEFRASCDLDGCSGQLGGSTIPVGSGITLSATGVSSATTGAENGTVVFEIDWPDLPIGTNLFVRVYGRNLNNPSDAFNDPTFYLLAVKEAGAGNTFLLAGAM
jgi:hypothetical protein